MRGGLGMAWWRKRVMAFGMAIAVGAALGACGSEESTSGSERLVPAGTKLQRLDISGTEGPSGGFRYRAPKVVRGGLVEMRFRNTGKAPRKAQLWRVGGGRSVRQALRVRRPLPAWLTWAGGVGLTRPGGTGIAVQRLLPGNYYVTGIGGERQGVAPLRVTPGGRNAEVPAPDARITAVDYGFRFAGLKPGRTAVEFRNTGKEPHHAFFAPLRDGRTLAEARSFLAGKLAGPPPVDPEATRETVVLEGRRTQLTRLNLESGRYAVLCFVRDRRGGPPHTEKGMVAEVKVP